MRGRARCHDAVQPWRRDAGGATRRRPDCADLVHQRDRRRHPHGGRAQPGGRAEPSRSGCRFVRDCASALLLRGVLRAGFRLCHDLRRRCRTPDRNGRFLWVQRLAGPLSPGLGPAAGVAATESGLFRLPPAPSHAPGAPRARRASVAAGRPAAIDGPALGGPFPALRAGTARREECLL
ncbi:hypothetical protein G6F40_015958 [Rhizopus arrhizus]|nr:hypothetical protein G6F40_015958 [Rhizopus arrhizus]